MLFLSPEAAESIRSAIELASGNEVCFVAAVGDDGAVSDARVVARGNRSAVVAAARDAEPGTLLIHNHPSGGLEPSDPDLDLAADLYTQGIGLAITDNLARELYVVVEPAPPQTYRPLDEDEIDALLAPGGVVSELHPGYEDRPTQRDMARAVARTYSQGGVLLAEAGTGTGKSIAYLLAAVRWAVANRERTIISTNTINLQEQLVGKDLPFVRKALNEPFRWALVKGRGNYISIRRLLLAAQHGPLLFEDHQRAELDTLVEWIKSTRDGSLQDLAIEPSPEVWDEVVSDSDVCIRARCPHFEQCFYQRARRDAAAADVLVVNHHLLFSDLAVRRTQNNYTAPAVLPPYRRVVMDEAHNIEDAATSHLGGAISHRGILRALGRLDRRGRGIMPAVEAKLRLGAEDGVQHAALQSIRAQLRPALERAREQSAQLFTALEALVARAPDGVLRLGEDFAGETEWAEHVEPRYQALALSLEELARGIDKLREQILSDARRRDELMEQLVELFGAGNRVRAARDGLRLALAPGKDNIPLVRWLERRGGVKQGEGAGRGGVVAHAAPVDLSDILRETLFDRIATAVLTSATLATRDGFGFLRRRIGLGGGGLRVQEASYPSPFDFESQSLVVVPTDLPVPDNEDSAAFDFATSEVVDDLVQISDGGAFVLFTSYRSLRRVAAELRRRGLEKRWPLFVQGDSPRAWLLDRFTRAGNGVLLGVASFWEGVDVPGEPLRALVLAKLPFRVPTEPLTAARIEAIEANGGGGFYDYLLPHAALRLKQGFGRLIRSRADRGVVVLLDRRVLERGYGHYLLESLPPAPRQAAPWSELRRTLSEFYERPAEP